MDKLEFIARQLAKAQKKKYEHYVVHRIWTLLNDLRVKFVTQQFIRRPQGRAMTDMFFPQLGIHIEVDEGFHKNQIDADKLREADIIDATGHEILRLDVTQEAEKINKDIDEIVASIKRKRDTQTDFQPWSIDMEQDPQTYIEKGFIDVGDDAAFRTMADAASCFGKKYKGLQMAYIPHPKEPGKRLWFPKFYENEGWSNTFSDDEETINEISLVPERVREHIDRVFGETTESRLVFARVKGPLGDLMYRFKGEYKLDREASSYENGLIHRRIATRVKTYIPESAEQSSGLTIEEFYERTVSQFSNNDRIKLAAIILNNLSEITEEN